MTAQRFEYETDQLRTEFGVPGRPFANLTEQQLDSQLSALVEALRADSGWSGQLGDFFEVLLRESDIYVWEWMLDTGDVQRYPETTELFGCRPSELQPRVGNFTRHIYSGHRERVERTVQQAIENGEPYQVQYVLALPDRSRRWLDECGFVVTDDDGRSRRVVGFCQDVTERKEYQRDLRWERELNETIREAFIDSQTRSELESTIARHLYEYGYSLVWTGDWLADELQPRTIVGKETQIETLGFDTSIERHERLPSVEAAIEDEPTFVSDFSGHSQTEWYKTAYRCGIRAAGCLPLRYNDVCYGVLSLYSEEPDAFDETTKRHLVGLSDTLAAVLHNIETQTVLSSDKRLQVKVQLFGANYYLRELLSRATSDGDDIRVTVHETLPYGDERVIQFVSFDGVDADAMIETASDTEAIDDVTAVSDGTGDRLQLIHGEHTPETTLAELGVSVESTNVTVDRTDVLIEVPTKRMLRTAIEALESLGDHVSVLSCTEAGLTERQTNEEPMADLTDRQKTVLQAAYHQGYFEQPRTASAKDVARSLDISHPTFLEHLRIAQGKLYDSYFS